MVRELLTGQQKIVQRTFSQEEVSQYVTLVGDPNPIHTSIDFCRQHGLERTVVPGNLITGKLVAIASSEFPLGAVLVSEEVKYRKPVYIDDEIELMLQVDKVLEGKIDGDKDTKIIRLSMEARKGDVVYLQGIFKALYRTRTSPELDLS